jgi:NADPH:quinone reductase
MRAIQITEYGGPEVLTPTELPDPEPGEGELLLDVAAAGVNYADTHHTENSYLTRTRLPFVPGAEAVGTTADGRRVVALTGDGGYAERATAPAALTFDVPEGVGDGAALALVLQGTTAWYLLRDSAHLEQGESVVVHAAAGGVGSLAVQLAKAWGAGRVIATASTQDKRDLALRLGADVAVDPNTDDLRGTLREANGGQPVDIVLEMVGGPVFDASLAALAPFGRIVLYGNASRTPASPVDPGALVRPSRAVIGYWLVQSLRRPERFGAAVAELFDLTTSGTLNPVVGGEYPLAEAHRAHEDLLARRSVGKLLLRP